MCPTRACLKIEKVPDFCPGRCGLTKKTASNTFVLRGFSTQIRPDRAKRRCLRFFKQALKQNNIIIHQIRSLHKSSSGNYSANGRESPFWRVFRAPPPCGRGGTDDYLCGLDNPPMARRLTNFPTPYIILYCIPYGKEECPWRSWSC